MFKADNETAFEATFREYYPMLCNYAYTFVHDDAEAEEIVQSVFLTFWEKRNTMDVHTSIKSYLFSMVRNSSLNMLKHKKIEQKYVQEALITEERSQESISQTVHFNELERKIAEAIEKLPEQCRLVFKMSRFEDLKYSEIAAQLNISVKTVENQIGKALKTMRTQLQDYLPVIVVLLSCLLNKKI